MKRRPKSNPWPDALPADVLVAMDFLEVHHPHMAMRIYDDIMARQEPLSEFAFVRGREHLRKDATVIALAELSQSVYRHHAAPMDAVLAVSEPHLEEARGDPDGIRGFLHEIAMNGGSDEMLSSEHGTMPTYERMGTFEPSDLRDWPLTFEELVLLTNNLFILRYSEMGGPPQYEAFPTKAEEQRAWEELEEQYADQYDDEEREERDERADLRDVNLDGFRLQTWDTFVQDDRGQTVIAYRLSHGGRTIFEGDDYAGSPMHADDSDATLRGLIAFLTLQPGDIDAEYFADYTPEQLAFARTDAEALSSWAEDSEEYPGREFVDWRD